MKLKLEEIIKECEEHVNAPNCEGCPFGGPEGDCLVQHSPASWNLDFLNDLLDNHLSKGSTKSASKEETFGGDHCSVCGFEGGHYPDCPAYIHN